ncbi:MAG: condensation domain-containing protein [Thermoactinomyces vulgaris]
MPFPIRGNLPVSRLEEAFRALVERHESLRTSFHLIDGELMQKIHTDVEVRVERYQARDRPDVKQKIQQFIRPFDLEKAPLIRVGMIEHAKEEEQILVIDMHHIISDGVSMNILFRDLMKCLQGETLPPVSLQYKDYAVWQQKEKQKDAWKKHEQYWMDELSGELPVLDLPTDYPRPSVQRFDGDHMTFRNRAPVNAEIETAGG